MKRYDPFTAPPTEPEALAPRTQEGHFLFHSQPGDVCARWMPGKDAPEAEGNILIVAHCPLMREAKRIFAAVQATGTHAKANAEIIPWLKGEKQKSMWTVAIPDLTPADVELARPFIPADCGKKPAGKPSANGKRVSLTQNENASATQRTTPHAAKRAAKVTHHVIPRTADKVSAMPVTTFAFLLESDDLEAAADAQRRFVAHLEENNITGEWRNAWSHWHAANPAPAKPAAPAMPVMPVLAKPHPLPRRDSILPIDPLAALRRLATK